MTEIAAATPTTAQIEGPVGLRGWLILPILHVVSSIGMTGFNLIPLVQNYEGVVAIARGSTDQLVAMRLPMALSLLGSLGLIAVAAAGLYAMLVRSPRAPKIMIGFYLVACTVTGEEIISDKLIQGILNEPADASVTTTFIRAVVLSCIWIPYFIRSRRVANTFRAHQKALDNKVRETFA